MVHQQPTSTSLILKDPETGLLVDGGALIPLDQILAGPRRARLAFARDEDSEVRPFCNMIADADVPRATGTPLRSGCQAGRRRGWGSLAPGAMVA